MTREQRLSHLLLDPVHDIIRELVLVEMTSDYLYDDEVQEILYRLSPVVAIGRRFGQGRPIEPITEIEMDKVREQVQDWYHAIREVMKDG